MGRNSSLDPAIRSQRTACRLPAVVAFAAAALTAQAAITRASLACPLLGGGQDLVLEPLILGPVDGLTMGWHETSDCLRVPMGVDLPLIQRHSSQAVACWSGPVEPGPEEYTRTQALFSAAEPGTYLITCDVTDASGHHGSSSLTVIVLSVGVDEVVVGVPSVEEAAASPFAGESTSDLLQVEEGHYITSIRRPVKCRVSVTPPEASDLVEWRVDGKFLLGQEVDLRLDEGGQHRVRVGLPDAEQVVILETYQVKYSAGRTALTGLTGQEGSPVLVDLAVTTTPRGFEDQVKWSVTTDTGYIELTERGPGAVTLELHEVFAGTGEQGAICNFTVSAAGQLIRVARPGEEH